MNDIYIPDIPIIYPQIYSDSRGYFFESFSQQRFNELVGREINFVQDNESKSARGVLRGLHFQYPPFAQSKLVRVVKGGVLDVAVDIRKGSPTFGKYIAVELTDENKLQLFIPAGFAHGFLALLSETIVQYKCDNYYNPQSEGTICFDDPDIGIDWKFDLKELILSDKDRNAPCLKDIEPFE